MSAHETNDPADLRRQRPPPTNLPPPPGSPPPPPPSSGNSDHHPPIPDTHPRPGGFHPPPQNHPSWPRPGTWNRPQTRYWRPKPGQFRPRPLHRPTIAWLPLSNIPTWLCNYVIQIYGGDPGCCDAAWQRGRNIYNFEVENCIWCGQPNC